ADAGPVGMVPASGGMEPADDASVEMLHRFPKAAYMTEIEWWRELEDGRIEFTMRRLASAD
ncbi:MAG: hypothetical protein ACK5AX_22585, partial [Bradyrhizobium sp.]